jgi:mannosyltransferase
LAGEAALLDHLSLSYDELFSVYFARSGPGFLLGPGWHQETNPPLYFLILAGWIGLFGSTALAVRSLSLLALAGALPVVRRIGRALGFGDAAWLAAALFLASPLAARYALTARPYALWLLVLAVALLALVEALQAATARRVLSWGAGFATAALVALYLHDSSLIFIAAADAVFLLVWLMRWPIDLHRLLAWALPQLMTMALGAPQLLIILAQHNSANIAWIPPPDLAGAILTGIELLTGRELPLHDIQGPALALILLILLVLAPLTAPRSTRPLAGLIVIGLGLCAGAGLLLPRVALWLLLPLALIAAGALTRLGRAWLRIPAIGLALVVALLDTACCLWNFRPEPWREFLAVLEAERQPGDAIVLFNGAPATALRYYQAGQAAPLYRWDATAIDGAGTAIRALDDRIETLPAIDAAGIRALLAQGHAVWLVSRLQAQRPFAEALEADFPATEHLHQRSVDIVRLAPP